MPGTFEGDVVGIGDGHLKIRVRDVVEELDVNSPMVGIRPGDHVRVSFREVNGRRVAQRVEELVKRQ
jgi:hypothetical protein